jgi:dUTP pyrophosphatase
MAKTQKIQVKIKKLSPDAVMPVRTHDTDACFDIFALKYIPCLGEQKTVIQTGIALEVPDGHFAKIYDRSGVASTTPLAVVGGIIDSGYRGEIKIIVSNISGFPYYVNAGDKIAQIAIHPIPEVELLEVKELSESGRGEKGFGSSDKK